MKHWLGKVFGDKQKVFYTVWSIIGVQIATSMLLIMLILAIALVTLTSLSSKVNQIDPQTIEDAINEWILENRSELR